MIRLPDIAMTTPKGLFPDVVNAAETITLQGPDASPIDLVTKSLGDSGPSILIGLGILFAIILVLRRMSRSARERNRAANDTGLSFAASVDIPPYVDTSNLASIAAKIDPEEASVRLANTWADARKKVEANPLYSPNANECIARDAIEIERIFCSEQLSKCLAKQPAHAFDRLAKTAETLGSSEVARLIGDAKNLAIKGHSPELQNAPRKGDAWRAFRQEIAALEAQFLAANTANGNAGRVVTLADAYMSDIAA